VKLQPAGAPVGSGASTSAINVANRRWLTILLKGRSFAVLGVLAILIVLFSLTTANFATADSFRSITVNAALFAIVACGQGVVILTRNYDLSVGSTMGMAAYVAYDWGATYPDMAPILIPVIALGIGFAIGVINGWLVGYARIPSIAATLGTLSVIRGVLFVYGDGRIVTRDLIPEWARSIVSTQVLDIVASLVIIAAIVVVVAALALRYLSVGRQIYAVGSNPAAVDFYGLDSRATIMRAYIFCGLMAGFAGFLFGPQVGYIIQYAGQNYELMAIAACVIGGISVLGGSGNILGAAFGALTLAVIDNGLVQLQLPEFARLVIQGGAIILAVMIDAIVQRQARSMLRSMRRRGVEG
jgi:rhamnose transport system permease protein